MSYSRGKCSWLWASGRMQSASRQSEDSTGRCRRWEDERFERGSGVGLRTCYFDQSHHGREILPLAASRVNEVRTTHQSCETLVHGQEQRRKLVKSKITVCGLATLVVPFVSYKRVSNSSQRCYGAANNALLVSQMLRKSFLHHAQCLFILRKLEHCSRHNQWLSHNGSCLHLLDPPF